MAKTLPLPVAEAASLQLSNIQMPDMDKLALRIQHCDTPQEALLILAKREDLPSSLRAPIAAAAQADEIVLETVSTLSNNHFNEWIAIFSRYQRLYESFLTNVDEYEPHSVMAIKGEISSPSLASAFFLKTGSALAQDFWHDLATRGILELIYERDEYKGDRFGPLYDEKIELSGSAELHLSPGIDCSWIADIYETDDEWEEDTYEPVEIVAAPYIVGKRFRDLSSEEVWQLIRNLLIADRHFIMNKFGITSHLLGLVLLHPNSTIEQKNLIIQTIEESSIQSTLEFLKSSGLL